MRNKIYELVLGFNRPVHLIRTEEIHLKHRVSHIGNCTSDKHPWLPNLTRSVADNNDVTWCVDRFNNIERKLEVPRSVLSLRHVCKQIDEEMRYIFFAINEFHFRDAAWARKVFSAMVSAEAMAAIEVMGFRFYGDGAPKLYPALAKACPNVRVLKVSMSPDDKRVIISGQHKSLRRARGVEAFATYIAGLEKLETFEIVGTDHVKETVDGVETSVEVDINHPLAIGSWFRANIEMGKMRREIVGREVIERERREKEKRVKEMKEKRKEQSKKREASRAEREKERLRLDTERLERERQGRRRLDRERRKQERKESQRIERERQERERQDMDREIMRDFFFYIN